MQSKNIIIFGILIGVVIAGSVFFAKRAGNGSDGSNSQASVQSSTFSDDETGAVSNLQEPPVDEGESSMKVMEDMPMQFDAPPEMALVEGVDYKAEINTTKGSIKIDLNEGSTPITVNNFVFLARKGFYDGTPFHRIIKGFMIQGGDPTGTGAGGPGYQFDDEPFDGEYTPGVVAMANAGPNTNGSQFFIMHGNTPLPKNYVIFGEVEDAQSMEVVDAIANVEVTASASGEKSQPVEEVLIESVEITEE